MAADTEGLRGWGQLACAERKQDESGQSSRNQNSMSKGSRVGEMAGRRDGLHVQSRWLWSEDWREGDPQCSGHLKSRLVDTDGT